MLFGDILYTCFDDKDICLLKYIPRNAGYLVNY